MTFPLIDTTHSESDQEFNPDSLNDEAAQTDLAYPKIRIQVGLALAFIGYLIFLLGARPSLFGLDRSPVVGFVQISVFLLGLAIINLGGYLTLNALWPEGKKTIAAEIGSRLISTGYVICVFTGMADIFGLGSHPLPNVFFGPLQARGMTLGLMTIAVGFLLMIRYKRYENQPAAPKKSEQPSKEISGDHQPEDSETFSIKLSTLFQ
jgi:hypothetical protein